MVKIDLITGFLGSGKTTFIKKYAKYLMNQGMNIGILENDFGAVNVDMMLLKDLEGDNCELEMVAGGCDADCHRRRFKTKLIAMGMCGYDRVIVEPSGIFDVDEFFDALREEPLDQRYEIGSVITIINAKLEEVLSDEAEYLLASEAANAGCIVLSRSQEASADEITNTKEHLNRALQAVHCSRQFGDEIIEKNWDDFTEQDLRRIQNSGYHVEDYTKLHFPEKEGFQSVCVMNQEMTRQELEEKVQKLFEEKEYGNVFRVKGFLRLPDERWLELNATRHEMVFTPCAEGQKVVIVIGEKMNKPMIEEILGGTEI